MMFLRDKHLYPTATLSHVISRAKARKSNNANDVKYVYDMLRWWIMVHMILVKNSPKVFKEDK